MTETLANASRIYCTIRTESSQHSFSLIIITIKRQQNYLLPIDYNFFQFLKSVRKLLTSRLVKLTSEEANFCDPFWIKRFVEARSRVQDIVLRDAYDCQSRCRSPDGKSFSALCEYSRDFAAHQFVPESNLSDSIVFDYAALAYFSQIWLWRLSQDFQ